jgi:hypothetical protein
MVSKPVFPGGELSVAATEMTYPAVFDVHNGKQAPRIALLAVCFDRTACTESDSFLHDELGEWMNINQVLIVRELLTDEAFERDSVSALGF